MPSRSVSLHKKVAHDLALRIMRNEINPGQQLPDVKFLCGQFGVSRTVVREAIKLLTAKGIVKSKPRVGMTVRPRSDWSHLDEEILMWRVEIGIDKLFFQDLIGMRRVIEPGSAELAALYGTDTERAEVMTLYEQLEATVDHPEAFVLADVTFHTAFLKASHNELVQQITQAIEVAIIAIARTNTHVTGSSRGSLPIHKTVAESVQARDAVKARESMRQLVSEASRDIDLFLSQLDHSPENNIILQHASSEIGTFLNNKKNR